MNLPRVPICPTRRNLDRLDGIGDRGVPVVGRVAGAAAYIRSLHELPEVLRLLADVAR